MLIDFNEKQEIKIENMNGGKGTVIAKMYRSDAGKVIESRLLPDSSIGLHPHPTSDDLNYVISGTGLAITDGIEEVLIPGCCHVCKKGSSHTIINTGKEDLVLITVVVEK